MTNINAALMAQLDQMYAETETHLSGLIETMHEALADGYDRTGAIAAMELSLRETMKEFAPELFARMLALTIFKLADRHDTP